MTADAERHRGAGSTPALLRLTPGPTVLRTAATIGLGMIPMHRLPRAVQAGVALAPAIAITGIIVAAQRRTGTEAEAEATAGIPAPEPAPATDPATDAVDPLPAEAPTSQRTGPARWVPLLAISGAMGAALAGAVLAGIRMDRAIEMALRRREVPAPRLVIGLASGAVSLVMDVIENRAPNSR